MEHFYMHTMKKEELFEYINSKGTNIKPKVRQKCINELQRRGIKIEWVTPEVQSWSGVVKQYISRTRKRLHKATHTTESVWIWIKARSVHSKNTEDRADSGKGYTVSINHRSNKTSGGTPSTGRRNQNVLGRPTVFKRTHRRVDNGVWRITQQTLHN